MTSVLTKENGISEVFFTPAEKKKNERRRKSFEFYPLIISEINVLIYFIYVYIERDKVR